MDNFSLYAVAATVTSFFRELPEPLLTHRLYNDFIRATGKSIHSIIRMNHMQALVTLHVHELLSEKWQFWGNPPI